MERIGFWSRVGAWLWGADREDMFSSPGASSATVAERMPSGRIEGPAAAQGVPPGASGPGTEGGRPAGGRANPSTTSPNDRLIQLVDAINGHLLGQRERTELMNAALHRLADGLERFPEASKAEFQLLERVAADSGAAVTNLKRLSETLAQLPELADGQREAMVTLHRELERGRESDQQLRESLVGVGRGIAALSEATQGLRPMLDRLRCEVASGQERLLMIVERHANRTTWLTVATVSGSALGILFALIALFRAG